MALLLPFSTPAAATTPANPAGMAILAGSTIVRADGTHVRLDLPRGTVAETAAATPHGYLVAASTGDTSRLWLFPSAGAPRSVPLGTTLGVEHWTVTHDGSMVVATLPGPSATVGSHVMVAYALPSLREHARVRFAAAWRDALLSSMGPLITGTVDRRIVANDLGGPSISGIIGVWDPLTRNLSRSTAFAHSWGATRDGRALYRLDRYGPRGWRYQDIASACVDLAPITAAGQIPFRHTGLCGEFVTRLLIGIVSPGGSHAVVMELRNLVEIVFRTAVVRTADLHAGRWQPAWINEEYGDPDFWDTDSTFLVKERNTGKYRRCGGDGRCLALRMPRVPGVEEGDMKPIERAGFGGS
ncbi:hypothetical protein ACFQX7_39435 [Luedemannella flava]